MLKHCAHDDFLAWEPEEGVSFKILHTKCISMILWQRLRLMRFKENPTLQLAHVSDRRGGCACAAVARNENDMVVHLTSPFWGARIQAVWCNYSLFGSSFTSVVNGGVH